MEGHVIKILNKIFFTENDLTVKNFSKNCIYLFYLIFFIIIAFNHDQFLSLKAYSVNLDFNNTVFDWYKKILYHPVIKHFSFYIITAVICALAFLIFSKRKNFLLKILTVYGLLNINHKLISISDGGYTITALLCVFLCIVNTSGTKYSYKNKKCNDFFIALSNTGFLLCKVQLSVMYLASGIYKLQGVLWQKGVALYYVLQNEEYSHPFWRNMIENNDFLLVGLTYSTIGFQVAYPFLIWNKNTRLLMLFTVFCFHIGTVFILGLTSFGVCGIVANTIFLRETDFKFLKKLKNILYFHIRSALKKKISYRK